jgi:post-segregation antitoxin (ccd killing protein)
MTRNLTIQLDENTIKRARIVATRRSISISRLVSEEINKAAETEEYWSTARRTALNQLNNPFHLGGQKQPNRESLYDR